MRKFFNLTSTFTQTIFTWSFFCDFPKIQKNSFKIKVHLSILNSLLGETDIENKFIEIIKKYPEIRGTLPILLAVRNKFDLVLDEVTKNIISVGDLFNKKIALDKKKEAELLKFLRRSGLKELFGNKHVTNLVDYVFGIETGLDSNARKNRSGKLMENIVEDFVKEFCQEKGFQYKDQATAKRISENRGIEIKSDKSKRRFDFAIYTGTKIVLIETNFYGGGGSKLKAVAGEFGGLYKFLKDQKIELIRVTDGLGRKSALKPLEEAYNATNGNIFNISMLKGGILDEIIK